LVTKQTKLYPGIRQKGSKDDRFFVSQWQLSLKDAENAFGTPLDRMALYYANQMLYNYGINAMTPDGYPTVILQDYVGCSAVGDYSSEMRDPSLRTLAIGLNLYMASQNCYVSHGKFPLLGKRVSTNRQFALVDGVEGNTTATGSGVGRAVKPWNGVIFANGTRYEEPPPGFSPMYPPLKAGMKFMNGTVVQPMGGAAALDC